MSPPLEIVLHTLSFIEIVDNKFCPSALYNVLTVNKTFFHAAVQRLYRDPLRSLSACRKQLKAVQRFWRLVVFLTPSKDPGIEDLRLYFDDELEDFAPKPYVDYFQFMTVIRYRPIIDQHTSCAPLFYTLEDKREMGVVSDDDDDDSDSGNNMEDEEDREDPWKMILIAVCNHRLPMIRSISIPSHLLQDYVDIADQMLNVEEIEILFDAHYSYDDDGDDEESWPSTLRNAIKDATTLVKRLKDLAASQPPQHSQIGSAVLDIQLKGRQDVPGWDCCEEELKALFHLLPKSQASLVSPGYDKANWTRFFMAPETFDLLSVKAIQQWEPFESPLKVEWLEDRIPDETAMYIIRQCRNLRSLHIALEQSEDEDIFKWAAKEASAAAEAGQPSGRPLIPLEHLELQIELALYVPIDKIVKDAVRAFRPTLQTVAIYSGFGAEISMFRDMPELRRLTLCSVGPQKAKHPLISKCPKLQDLELHDDDFIHNDLGFARWSLPSLRRLSLAGGAVWKFHQNSWRSMATTLEVLELHSELEDNRQAGIPLLYSWGPWASLSFPRLRCIKLNGSPAETFTLSMLVKCPVIESLDVRTWSCGPEASLGDLNLLRRNPLPLTSLVIRGQWAFTATFFLETLPAICPQLRKLEALYPSGLSLPFSDFVEKVMAKFEHMESVRFSYR